MEPTATNPQTGEKVVFRGGQWVPMDGGQQPAPTGPLQSPPVMADPLDIRRDARQEQQVRISQQGANRQDAVAAAQLGEIERRRAKDESAERETAAKVTRAQNAASFNLANVIDKIDNIRADATDNGGLGETGASGAFSRKYLWDGTAGFDLAENLKTIDANSAFTALQAMRDASPTGGALGQITEKELELLKASISNLNPNQSQEQFIANLDNARSIYLDMLGRVDPEAVAAMTKVEGEEEGLSGGRVVDKVNQNGEGGSGGGGYGEALLAGVGDIAEGAGDLLGIVGNPVNATINAALGTNLSTDLGATLRGDLPKGNETVGAINQGAVAALGGAGLARAGASIASGTTQNVLGTIGRTPLRDMAAGGGAGAGGALGKASGIPGGEIAGTLIGGVAGYGGANALARTAAPRGAPNALASAAERQGIDLIPADTGRTVPGMLTTGAKAMPISAGPIRATAQRGQEQFGAAVRRTARQGGEELETDEAGALVKTAAERFTKQTSERGSRLYDKANELAKGVRPKPINASKVLDENIARLGEMAETNKPMIDMLGKLKRDIESGVSVSGLRDARTALSGGVYDGKLRSNQEQKILRDVLGALSEDIEAGLRSVGREDAANAFRRADTFWKQRVEQIDEVLQPILGNNKSGEEIVSSLEGMSRGRTGGNARLSRLFGSLTEEEAGNLRATFVTRLGKAKPGAQNEDGTAFSPATFLTNWNTMTPQAKSTLFSDPKMRANLNDLATIARGTKAGQAMANSSNTGIAIGSNVGTGVALGMANPALAVIGAGAQYATGKLMASPGFARWLARNPSTPAGQRKWVESLGIIAGREPLIAADAKALQSYLTDAFGQSPGRAAAQDEGDSR